MGESAAKVEATLPPDESYVDERVDAYLTEMLALRPRALLYGVAQTLAAGALAAWVVFYPTFLFAVTPYGAPAPYPAAATLYACAVLLYSLASRARLRWQALIQAAAALVFMGATLPLVADMAAWDRVAAMWGAGVAAYGAALFFFYFFYRWEGRLFLALEAAVLLIAALATPLSLAALFGLAIHLGGPPARWGDWALAAAPAAIPLSIAVLFFWMQGQSARAALSLLAAPLRRRPDFLSNKRRIYAEHVTTYFRSAGGLRRALLIPLTLAERLGGVAALILLYGPYLLYAAILLPEALEGRADPRALPSQILAPLLGCALAAALLFGLSGALWAGLRRTARLDATTLIARDPRQPVLFLRSFSEEQMVLPAPRLGLLGRLLLLGQLPRRLDHLLIEEGSLRGPVLALGRPKDLRPPFGATRLYSDDEEWRRVARNLAERACRIVLVLDPSPAVAWEIALAANDPELRAKTLFLIPPGRGRRRWARAMTAPDAPAIDPALRFALADPDAIGVMIGAEGQVEALLAEERTALAYMIVVRSFLERDLPEPDAAEL